MHSNAAVCNKRTSSGTDARYIHVPCSPFGVFFFGKSDPAETKKLIKEGKYR